MHVGVVSDLTSDFDEELYDLLEIRLDLLKGDPLSNGKKAQELYKKPLLFTFRNQKGKEELLAEIARLQPAWIDLEWECDVLVPKGVSIVRSYHGRVLPKRTSLPANHLKIVLEKGCVQDALTLLSTYPNSDTVTSFAMGESLSFTRVLASWRYIPIQRSVASGQLFTYPQVCRKASTQIYALLGNPVSNSPSYLTHNAVFKALNIDALYVKIPCTESDIPILTNSFFSGFSITMPLKNVFKDTPVNTMYKESGAWHFANTDGIGARAALRYPKGKHIHLIGKGGTAQAIKAALEDENVITISSRTVPDREKNIQRCDILINCSPVGMRTEESPVDKELLKTQECVFDCVHGETTLIKWARDIGIPTVTGYHLFIEQALFQFTLWFKTIDKELARTVMAAKIEDAYSVSLDLPSQQTGLLQMPQPPVQSMKN